MYVGKQFGILFLVYYGKWHKFNFFSFLHVTSKWVGAEHTWLNYQHMAM